MLPRKFPAVIFLLYLQILYISVSCEDGISLAFVIDDTLSMTQVINDVKAHAKSILDVALDEKSSEVKDLVLVSINDPVSELKVKTNSSSVFIKHLNDIYVHSSPTNKYCPEMAMAGIQEALLKSRVGSYMFVFTDSLACDADKVEIIKDLAQKKQTQVIIILIVGYCYTPSNTNTVYHDVAKASSGQVMAVDINEMDGVLKVIRELLHGKKTVLKWEELPRTYGGRYHEVKFFVDEKTDYVTIHSNSRDISLEVETLAYPGFHETVKGQKRVMWSSNSKVVMLSYPKSGTYYAKVAGSTTITLVVYARTDFTFEHGFSTYETNSLNNTSKQPSNKGIRQHLYIQIIDPDNSVQVKNVQLLNLNGEVLEKKTLRNVGIHFYVTSPFRAPTQLFNIVVVGKMTSSGKEIKRVSKTPVEPPPPIPESIPTVKLNEGNFLEVKYGKEITLLTCKVNAHPVPAIVWTDGEGHTLPSQSLEGEAPEYISYLKLNNLKKSDTYTCKASNTKGTSYKRIKVDVKSAFEIVSTPKAINQIPYGSKQIIRCDIKSSYSKTVTNWYRESNKAKSTKTPVHSSEKLSISSDGTELIINRMDLDLRGKFTCEASLASDKNEKISFDTVIDVIGLVSPVIVHSKIEKNGNELKAMCRVKGVPKPVVSWQLKPKGSNEFRNILGSGEELNILHLSPKDSGVYKCVAKNYLGDTSHYFDYIEVIPETKPNVFIKEGLDKGKIQANYHAGLLLTCKVNAYPQPEIKWFNSDGKLLESKSVTVNTTEYFSEILLRHLTNTDSYTCRATNNKGSSESKIQVEVLPAFRTISSPAATTNVKYGAEVKIVCNIQSKLPMHIRWYKSETELIASKIYSISADRTTLIIKAMDLDSQGNYTCQAYLTSEPSNKVLYRTDVRIAGLERPVIESSNKAVYLMKRDKFELRCKITKGYPKPQMHWLKKDGDIYKQMLHEHGEVLLVTSAILSHSGQYKCVAQNGLAAVSALFDVKVRGLPESVVIETQRNFPYGSAVEFTCKVESHVLPTITWIDKSGTVLENKVAQTSTYNFISRLKLESVKKSGMYTCLARNDVGNSRVEVDMKVSSPFVVRQHPETLTEIPYGTERIIPCDIKSSHPMTIQWYRQNRDVKSIRNVLHPSDKLSISPDGTKLTIKSMDLDLKGTYICEASLKADQEQKNSFNTHINVTGLVYPEVVGDSFMSGNKAFTAICRAKGVPKPVITWLFKPKGSEKLDKMSIAGEELNIPKLSLKDTGTFKCVVNNILGEVSHNFDLVVKEEPKITNVKDKYKSLKGDRVLRIPCEVTGFPVPAIIWRKAGEVVQKNSKYDIIGNVLYIKNLEETDTAKYTCTAVNELGTAQKSFDITVTDGFKTNDYDLKGKIHSIFTIKNKPVTILCNATNSDTLQVRWYMNGNDTQRRGNSYSIASATEGDNGIYTCRADTSEGSTSESYELHVGYPPTFVYDSPSVIEWTGDNVDLDCNVKSEPEPQIQWFHNGKEIPMSNLTQELEGKDWGEYKCILSNVHGSVQRTFKIVSTDCYVNQYMTTQNMPLWFDDDMKTWPMSSSSGGISLKAHKTITLVCAAKEKSPNAFQVFPNKNKITAECYKEDQFIVDGKTYTFSELQCKTKVEPLIVNTHEECSGPHTEMIQVGFAVDHFMEAYKVCYDKSKKVPVFGSTPIIISDFTRNEQSLFEWSQIPTVGDGKPSVGYTCQHNLTDCCYTKSQLVSVEEVVFGPAQAATLIDNLNSVAVWVPCNRDTILTWETFEKQVRALSSESSWVSWSGASDYRIKNHGLVPQYLWKVINNQEDYYTVVVYINNPEYEESDQRCSSSCDLLNLAEMGFDSLNFYCCNLDEFSKAFGVPTQSFKSTRI